MPVTQDRSREERSSNRWKKRPERQKFKVNAEALECNSCVTVLLVFSYHMNIATFRPYRVKAYKKSYRAKDSSSYHFLPFIHSIILDIYIAPLQEIYSVALSVQLRSKGNVLRSLQKEDTL